VVAEPADSSLAQLPPTTERSSIRDVARAAGVSAACVSNVLNGRRAQDDAIGVAVRDAVARLGYRANAMAANLRRTNSRLVGVVLPDFENPFFGALLSELERCAEVQGYRLTAISSREDVRIEAREVAELMGWRLAGLLYVPTMGSAPATIAAAGMPVVMLDRVLAGAPCDTVTVDNAASARAMTARLIDLGHQRILLACSEPMVGNIAERIAGVEAAVADAQGRVVLERLACGLTVDSANRAFAAHLAANPVPTAIFALQNLAALAAYGAVQRLGLRPGPDVALASFDDSAWMAHVYPAVAAVAQPVKEIARAAWARLMARLEGEEGPFQTLRVPCSIQERGTLTAPLQR
jgi:LacI family transcriptional regulator